MLDYMSDTLKWKTFANVCATQVFVGRDGHHYLYGCVAVQEVNYQLSRFNDNDNSLTLIKGGEGYRILAIDTEGSIIVQTADNSTKAGKKDQTGLYAWESLDHLNIKDFAVGHDNSLWMINKDTEVLGFDRTKETWVKHENQITGASRIAVYNATIRAIIDEEGYMRFAEMH